MGILTETQKRTKTQKHMGILTETPIYSLKTNEDQHYEN